MIIREATDADKTKIQELRVNGVRDSFKHFNGDPEIVDNLVSVLASEERVETDIADPDRHLVVAERDGEIIGVAALSIDGDAGELRSCFCKVKGEGVGSALLEERVRIARERGLSRVWIETDTINPGGMAHAERHGFKKIASRPGKTIKVNSVITFELVL